MKPPVYYQGGKGRLAPSILAVIAPHGAQHLPAFADFCCGSGGVFLRAVADGLPASRVLAVDSGPWGDVWAVVGAGLFPIRELEYLCRLYRKEDWKEQLDEIALIPSLPAFLLCQAGAYGGHPVTWTSSWKRRARKAGSKSNERPSEPCPWVAGVAGVGPAQTSGSRPLASSILSRMQEICDRCFGMRGLRALISPERLAPLEGVSYFDPPYLGTTGYGTSPFDVELCARALGGAWISEERPLSEHAVELSANLRSAAKGFLAKPRKEWLSWVY